MRETDKLAAIILAITKPFRIRLNCDRSRQKKKRHAPLALAAVSSVVASLLMTMTALAEDLLVATVSCNDDGPGGTVTITATDGLSAVDATGSTLTGYVPRSLPSGKSLPREHGTQQTEIESV